MKKAVAKKKAVKKVAAVKKASRKPLAAGTRDTILAAALRTFAQDGFDGASLPKIAEAAGIGHPLIHYYFGSKDNLWRETVEHYLGDTKREAETIRSASRGLSPLDRLRVMMQSFTHFAARCPEHFALIVAEARSGSERFVWLQENYGSVYISELESLLTDAQQSGQLRPVAVNQLSFVLMGAVLLYFTVNPMLPKDVEPTVLADEYGDLLFDMLINGFGAQTAAAPAVRTKSRA